ncbi:DNA polymerase subunit gamma-1, mitochondrial isoform X2 [Bicyclus anynana]|uniref:DNA-directed DNA polymerase n=1 Tax=Bicyclus anynana TaxID=110368 RepID=A0ABM3LZQ6_BICAN|nr:DNA polymerase subunit gamma-1, mitochondrial isoform X2 [Bicyclus anynana]
MLQSTRNCCILCRRHYSDVLPTREIKVIKQVNVKNKAVNCNLQDVKIEENRTSKEFRVNELNIQMISRNIYEQLFKGSAANIDSRVITSCQDDLKRHGIDFQNITHAPDVELKLPELKGKDLLEHFYTIGNEQSAPYKELLKVLSLCLLPPLPKEWLKQGGWTRYSKEQTQLVPWPPDDALILDVEVLMSAGKRPTLACAVSPEAWYGWVSEPLATGQTHQEHDSVKYEDLIPLETDSSGNGGDLSRPRIVVGHNVSYDRAKIKEQYWLEKTGVRFMDTMSMHTCVSGVTSYQRTVLKARSKEPHPTDEDWVDISSLNSLTDVHNLYCGVPINKESRDIFVEGTLQDVQGNFQKLMKYCAGDVIATHNVLKELLPLFLERFPHPVTLAGMLELGYPAWYRKLCTKPGKDPDWVPGANNVTTSMQITPKLLRLSWEGYPLHYLQSEGWGFLVPYSRTQEPVSGEPAVPLLKLLETCPLMNCKESDFEADVHMLPKTVEEDLGRRAYYARKSRDEQAAANQYHGLGVWCGLQIQGCCHFLRLPHKDGPKYKVGNPLAKDFLNMFSQNVLSAQGNEAEKVLSFGRMMSYWRNNRERVMGQQVVWLPHGALPARLRRVARRYGAIVPQVAVCGTLTRRASEPTWMTASNAHKERIGSELRAMVQAPPGYRLVGADVDSQELWIAALLGDSGIGLCGGSAFGWAVLAGDKRCGSDLHSLTARAADINRDHAKVINYARIYGAGQNFAERLLKQFNPTMTISEAKSKAAKMFTTTKGRRVYRLKEKYMQGFVDEDTGDQPLEMSGYQAMRLAKLSGKKLEEMFHRGRWVGGTESLMFNKLEEIADSESPATAFLSGRLSRALEHAGGRWGGTRLNWAVQSAAADFLHLMLASMAHLAPRARFCLSFHDEVRYLVPEEYKYETALALQITNLFTRGFCSQRVGIHDLPMSVAFFTSVEVDQVLRKEANLCCTTPSNPHGLEKGYGIPHGESLTIFDVLEKCNSNK